MQQSSYILDHRGITVYTILKLSKTIKDEHEIYLAQMEIEYLAGKHTRQIANLADVLIKGSLASFVGMESESPRIESNRFQDYFLYEPAYGPVQGFEIDVEDLNTLEKLQNRLAYSSEIYAAVDDIDEIDLSTINSIGIDKQVFSDGHGRVFRLIVHQFYYESAEYILKIAKNLPLSSLKSFLDRVFESRFSMIKRIPASAGARIGKRLLDYIAERKEPSLYLAHGLYPYKGRFHPRLSKALVNIVHPENRGLVIDCFSGSGTSLIEANTMGLDAVGLDVNPVAVVVAQAKTELQSTSLNDMKLLAEAQRNIHEERTKTSSKGEDYRTLQVGNLEPAVVASLLEIKGAMERYSKQTQNYLILALAMTVSALKKKKKPSDSYSVFSEICGRVVRVGFLSTLISEKLGIRRGTSIVLLGDSTKQKVLRKVKPVYAGVNSPPYSTAIDYIGNDLEQLHLLGFVKSKDELDLLDSRLAGNPRKKHTRTSQNRNAQCDYVKKVVNVLTDSGRPKDAAVFSDFASFLNNTLSAQSSSFVEGSKLAIVIGNNHLKISAEVLETTELNKDYQIQLVDDADFVKSSSFEILRGYKIMESLSDSGLKGTYNRKSRSRSNTGTFLEIENDKLLVNLASRYGLFPFLYMKRPIEKSLRGNIRYEAVVVFEKHSFSKNEGMPLPVVHYLDDVDKKIPL